MTANAAPRLGLSDEQHAVRSTGIGSSDIAAILGEDDDKSALDVWLEKTGRSHFDGNEFTRMGHRAEVIIADEFAFRHGVRVATCTTTRHHENPIVVATPDRMLVDVEPLTLLECKRIGYRAMRRWFDAHGAYRAPAKVFLQGTWQALVMGAAHFWIAADIGGRDWHDEHHDYDAELAENLVVVGERFWHDHVLAGVAPEPDDTARARKMLERMYSRASLVLTEPTPALERLAREYADAAFRESAARREKTGIGNKICALLGEYAGTDADWGRVRWVAPKRGRVAWARVAKELNAPADMIAKHTSEPARKLTVKVFDMETADEDEGSEES